MFLQPVRFDSSHHRTKKKSRLRQGGRLSRGTTKPGSSGSSLPSKRLTYPTLGSLENHRLKHAILGGYVSFLEGMFSRIKPPTCLDHQFLSWVVYIVACLVLTKIIEVQRGPFWDISRVFAWYFHQGVTCNPCVPLYVSKDGASIV